MLLFLPWLLCEPAQLPTGLRQQDKAAQNEERKALPWLERLVQGGLEFAVRRDIEARQPIIVDEAEVPLGLALRRLEPLVRALLFPREGAGPLQQPDAQIVSAVRGAPRAAGGLVLLELSLVLESPEGGPPGSGRCAEVGSGLYVEGTAQIADGHLRIARHDGFGEGAAPSDEHLRSALGAVGQLHDGLPMSRVLVVWNVAGTEPASVAQACLLLLAPGDEGRSAGLALVSVRMSIKEDEAEIESYGVLPLASHGPS